MTSAAMLAIVLAISGCRHLERLRPILDPPATPTHVATSTPAPSLEATPTEAPTATPEPSATPTEAPAPLAVATPTACPPLFRWSLAQEPRVHTFPREACHVWDTTPRFDCDWMVRRCPCNHEQHRACQVEGAPADGPWRHCEDPRGPWFSVSGDGVRWSIASNPFMVRICVDSPAGQSYAVTACPLDDLKDGLGQSVEALPGACDSRAWRF